jgi:hypothetical protein
LTFGNDASYGFLGMCEIDEMLAHHIQAVFEGDEPCSATAYALTPNGTEYAACTTVQYGFKPASNVTWLAIELYSKE